ncbi:hypothetical protein KAI32_03765 [Candidatus Pacearchaeota archaeon]|nr:hypothetical protein [Candidatus Pacearchaeota archaeon]
MVFDNSYPIQVKIIITWKKKYKGVKEKFENDLKAGCSVYSGKKRDGMLKYFNIEKDFYDEYDIVGKTLGIACQQSYILKDRLSGSLRTQFSLFNNQQNIKKEIEHIRKILNKTLKEDSKTGFMAIGICSWEENFSINGMVDFEKITFPLALKQNLYLFFGWFIAPAVKIANIYSTTQKNLNISDVNISTAVGTLQKIMNNTTEIEVIVSITIITLFYFLISIIKWRQNQNVIRI